MSIPYIGLTGRPVERPERTPKVLHISHLANPTRILPFALLLPPAPLPTSVYAAMDPVTAIGLVSSILTFVSFSTKLVSGAIKIHESLDGALEENRSREVIAREMKSFAARLLPPDDSRLAGEEKDLCALAKECRAISGKLVGLLDKVKPKDPGSKSQSLWAALKTKVYESERADLEQRLENCRSQLELQLAFFTR